MQVHISAEFRAYMKDNHPNIIVLYIPPNCTGKLQPQDVVVQKPFKAGIEASFRQYQTQQFLKTQDLEGDENTAARKKLTDFRMSVIKPMTPDWIYAGWLSVARRPEMVRRGWAKCMLLQAFDDATQKRALLAMSDSASKFYPLFPKNDSRALPASVEEGVVEPLCEPVTAIPNEIELDSDEAAHIEDLLEVARQPPPIEPADQLLGQPCTTATESAAVAQKRKADFLALFKQPQPAKKGKTI